MADEAKVTEFPDHSVIKKIEIRPSGEVFLRCSLPPKEAGVSGEELDRAWKRELWIIRDSFADALQGATVFLCGPLVAGMEGTFGAWFANRLRAAYRENFTDKKFRMMFGSVKDSSFSFLELQHRPDDNAYAAASRGRAIEL